jgi:hypothetical protein
MTECQECEFRLRLEPPAVSSWEVHSAWLWKRPHAAFVAGSDLGPGPSVHTAGVPYRTRPFGQAHVPPSSAHWLTAPEASWHSQILSVRGAGSSLAMARVKSLSRPCIMHW